MYLLNPVHISKHLRVIPDAEDKIKELIQKSNSAELKYLQNETSYLKDKTKELEKRIEVVENSVEDLEAWRHS